MKKTIKWFLRILCIPLAYIAISLITSYIPVGSNAPDPTKNLVIYLSTNGVHADVILSKEMVDQRIISGLLASSSDQYYSFGWGDKDFFINTPTWAELKFTTAVKALFLPSETLMHVVRHSSKSTNWKAVSISPEQLKALNEEILKGFAQADQFEKTLWPGHTYFGHDEFYTGEGSYSCLCTCNTWLNSALKAADIKTALWTPFDFGIIHWHE